MCENLMNDNIPNVCLAKGDHHLKKNHLIHSDDRILQLKCSKDPNFLMYDCFFVTSKCVNKCGPPNDNVPHPEKLGCPQKRELPSWVE